LSIQKAKELLAEAANEFYEEVAQIKPQWKFSVVYDVVPHVAAAAPASVSVCGVTVTQTPVNQRPFMAKCLIGRLSIARAGNRNGSSLSQFTLPKDAKVTPELISSEPMLFTVLKAERFANKLEKSRDLRFLEFGMNYNALRAAIISDLTEEQASIRRFQWSGPIPEPTLLEHVPNFCAFVGYAFTMSASGEFAGNNIKLAVEVGTRMHVLLKRWMRWHDRIMIGRRTRVLTSLCTSILEKMLARHKPDQLQRTTMLDEEFKKFKEKGLEELIADCRNGVMSCAASNNTELRFRGMARGTVQRIVANEKPPHVVVDRWAMNTIRDRRLILHKLRCDFNAVGKVKEKTTREEQHNRLDFLGCMAGHPLIECPAGIAGLTCRICDEPVSKMGAKQCAPCGWVVCFDCFYFGNIARWQPRIEEEATV